MACSASIVLYSRPPVFLWRLWNHSIPPGGRIGLPISFLVLGVVPSVLHSIFCIGVGSGWPFPVLGSSHSWVSPSNACGPCNLLVCCGPIAIVVGSVLLFVVGLHTAGSHVAGGGLHQRFWWTFPRRTRKGARSLARRFMQVFCRTYTSPPFSPLTWQQASWIVTGVALVFVRFEWLIGKVGWGLGAIEYIFVFVGGYVIDPVLFTLRGDFNDAGDVLNGDGITEEDAIWALEWAWTELSAVDGVGNVILMLMHAAKICSF